MPVISSNRYVLLDASLVAGYYLPAAGRHARAQARIIPLIESVRNGLSPNVFLYIPNTCIAEVFDTLAKYRHGAKWNAHVKKALPRGLTKKAFLNLRAKFASDIHNGAVIYQCELNRYHVLASDLISIVDNTYRHYRGRKNVRPMGTKDHLIVGMGIHLAKVHGHDNFAIMTSDHRMAALVDRARRVRMSRARQLGLVEIAGCLGLRYGEVRVFPRILNLASCRNQDLQHFFGEWPPPVKIKQKCLAKWDKTALAILIDIITKNGTPRDQLPSSLAMERICLRFNRVTGLNLSANALWRKYANWEKAGKKGRKARNKSAGRSEAKEK